MARQNAVMTKVAVNPSLTLYSFLETGERFGHMITVLHREQRGLIIDTAYPEYAGKVAEDLATSGIRPEMVLISHYHPDHTAGCSVFEGCRIFAGGYYHDNHRNCQLLEPEYTYATPDNFMQEGDVAAFAGMELHFYYTPGHSRCSFSIGLPEDVLHVGDLLMNSTDGKTILPYIAADGSFEEHIRSLKRIRDMAPRALLLPHGVMLTGADVIREQIADRLHYLETALRSGKSASLAACLKHDASRYDYTEFHNANLIRLL